MRTIDMFLHPILQPSEESLFDLSNVSFSQLTHKLEVYFQEWNIDRGMLCLFDDRVLTGDRAKENLSSLQSSNFLSLSYVADFRNKDGCDIVSVAAKLGFCSIAFHSYLQEIEAADFDKVLELAKVAEKLGLFICICSAYGSKKIYKYHSLPLAVHLAESVNCPIVLIHGGGAKILEAFLIADMFPNIYLETSFSLPYWMGSSIEMDFAYVMKKLGCHRWMYGSDAPFMSFEQSIQTHMEFFKKYNFSDRDIDNVLSGTAAKLLKA